MFENAKLSSLRLHSTIFNLYFSFCNSIGDFARNASDKTDFVAELCDYWENKFDLTAKCKID